MSTRRTGTVRVRLRAAAQAQRAEIYRALQRGALAIEATAVDSIQTIEGGYKQVPSRGRKGAMHEVSPPGRPPNADTGELHQSIHTVTTVNTPERLRVEVGAHAPHAEPLEFGTDNMAPRPFMSPAYHHRRAQIEAAVRRAARMAMRRARP